MMITGTSLKCPICATLFEPAQNNVPYVTDRTAASNVARPERISFCPECEVGIAFPQLTNEEIDGLYTDGDYWQEKAVRIFLPKNNPGQYVMAESRWQLVENYLRSQGRLGLEKISILDIGGGHGFFGMAASKSRRVILEKVSIVEKDKYFIQSAKLTWERELPHIDFSVEESIENISRERRFNLVVLSHVLEHLNDPKGIISSAAGRMFPGGLIFIDLPNRDYLFKKDIFPHVLFFSGKSLEKLLTDMGFEVEFIEYFGWNRETSSLNFRNERKFISYLAKLLYKLRFLIPIGISKRFFDWHLGASRNDSDGTWKGCWLRSVPSEMKVPLLILELPYTAIPIWTLFGLTSAYVSTLKA